MLHAALLSPVHARWQNRQRWIFPPLLALLDLTSFFVLYLYFLDLRSGIWSWIPGQSGFSWVVVALGGISLISFLAAIRGYDLRVEMRSLRFATEHILTSVFALAATLFLVYAIAGGEFSRSRSALAAAFVFWTPISLITRRMLRAAVCHDLAAKTIAVLGTGAPAAALYQHCIRMHMLEHIRAFDVEQARLGRPLIDAEKSPVIEDWSRLDRNRIGNEIECIVVTIPRKLLSDTMLEELVRLHFYRAPVLTLEAFYEAQWQKIPVAALDPVWALQQDFRLARSSPYRLFKRLIDIAAAVVGLLLTSPILALLPIFIRLESRGPALFRQARVGLGERSFTLYKFRTMREGSDDELYTSSHDPRVTPLGRILRKLRLDELPQLWNVLRGDMSLIGPRAEWTRLVQNYESEISCYHFRHLVKPGITGWAQVNYPYGDSLADAVEKLQYDLYYIKHYSLFLDLSISLKTLYVMASFKGR